jgi:hypothetical protein
MNRAWLAANPIVPYYPSYFPRHQVMIRVITLTHVLPQTYKPTFLGVTSKAIAFAIAKQDTNKRLNLILKP